LSDYLELTFNIGTRELYYVANNIRKEYTKTEIKKKNGGTRTIYMPSRRLKYIQRMMLDNVLTEYKVSGCATAYHNGAKLINNATPHLNKKYLLKLDIEDFFPSIEFGRVYKMFCTIFTKPYAKLYAELCCYDDHLVQGAPTSPAISNIIMRDFDNALEKWCKERNIAYTRYCDDITLSSDEPLNSVYYFVKHLLYKNGFELNRKKTHFVKNTHRQIVTGIVVNEKAQVSRDYRRKLRQDLYYLHKFGAEDVIRKNNLTEFIDGSFICDEEYVRSLAGKINYILQIDPGNDEFIAEKGKIEKYIYANY